MQSRYRAWVRRRLRNLYRQKYQPFLGKGFQCNVCGAQYSRFVPDLPAPENREAIEKNAVVAGYGEHIICPNCLSNARERLVLACLQELIKPASKNVLHLSPERNVYAYLKNLAVVNTADLNPGFYRDIDPAISRQDATRLGYADNTFDLLIANHVLEHIPDDRKAMREFFRVLKPGGRAVLQVPYSNKIPRTLETPGISDPARQSALYGQNDHVRIYLLDDYIQRLREAGFEAEILAEHKRKEFEKFATQPGEEFLLMRKP